MGMSRNIVFSLDEHYHLYNRGVEKRVVFEDIYDYQRFLLLLLLANDARIANIHQSIRDYTIPELIHHDRTPLVRIETLSLMPTHYHLLVTEITEGGISAFMHKLGTGYTMFFNLKYEHSGPVFQGTFKARHINSDRYLRYMYEYIHLNPIRELFENADKIKAESLIQQAEREQFTGLSVYSGRTEGKLTEAVLETDLFHQLFNDYNSHRKLLLDWREEPFE